MRGRVRSAVVPYCPVAGSDRARTAALGPPTWGGPRAVKSGAPGRAPGRPALPSSQTGRLQAVDAASTPAVHRHAADLHARPRGSGAARARLTGDSSSVRVRDGGGGRPATAHRNRPGSRSLEGRGAERCLAQRRELECCSQSTAHQLAERASVRATCRQHREHVFGKVRARSDGRAVGPNRSWQGNGSSAPKKQPPR